ncbi:glycoside hydrolase family 55 protein [Niallia sp. NCCP-28]|uniref:glycoside hydrolase family 55 protein n=1 Tax=Niallia sp. NCCP-28 TaxID=2934712 RepID=UPI002088CFCF|nr:glycoside hydrolase family 55 protein [Niallia sp. NCCP-28]GKU83426.1 pectate lyase [Niallia sp. NCCP-28]
MTKFKLLLLLLITIILILIIPLVHPIINTSKPLVQKNNKPFDAKVLELLDKDYKIMELTFYPNADPTIIIQNALNEAKNSTKPIKIIVPPGQYKLTQSLHIYSNTWLHFSNNTVLKKATNHHEIMLINGDFHDSYQEYNGNSNIVVDGGIWDAEGADPSVWTPSIFGFAHGKNIIIQNVVLKNISGGHAIDCAGNKNIIIQDSKFLGFNISNKNNYVEAIQIDGMISSKAFRRFGDVDSTVTKNILIQNNYFGNSHVKTMKPWGVGIGSHSALHNHPHSTIRIINNTFEGLSLAAIKAYNWSDVIIKGNKMIDCYVGIQIEGNGVYYLETGNKESGELAIDNFHVTSNKFYNIENSSILITKSKNPLEQIIMKNNLYQNSATQLTILGN